MKVAEVSGLSRCDNGHIFKSSNAELKEFGNFFHVPMANIKFVARDGTLMSGNPKPTDMVMACPKCHAIHLFGFDIATKTK